ncbi:MAG TPA: response regulator [Verrucomicrobiae bacterium]|jgi:HD-like signal output (HDOD) protein|nr:response regulator [Verrucomicrobiae bacterium]
MSDKLILIADSDPLTATQFAAALGEGWKVKSAASGPAALAALEAQPCDALVASLGLAELDGPQLLNRARQKYPDVIRFLIATEADRAQVIKEGLAQQFLTKPCDPATIRSALENAVAVDKWITDDAMRELVSRIRSLPTIPSIYLEVRAALKSPSASPDSIGAILGKDMAMTTKLLQVCNSSYFGLSRKITDVGEAVGLLGFDTVNSIVVAVKMLGYYDRIKPAYYSVDRLWRHSLNVAQHARKLALLHGAARGVAEAAYTAGLMHDLGKIVLVCNFCQEYEKAQVAAAADGRALWQVEKETFGATHADIGAYLLGRWGMPTEASEAAALHHQPLRTASQEFTVLTAVHVANALEDEINPPDGGLPGSTVDTIYLARIGCLSQLDAWREAITGQAKAAAAPAPAAAASPAAVSAPVSAVPAAAPAPAAEAPRASWFASFFHWLGSFWQPSQKTTP